MAAPGWWAGKSPSGGDSILANFIHIEDHRFAKKKKTVISSVLQCKDMQSSVVSLILQVVRVLVGRKFIHKKEFLKCLLSCYPDIARVLAV